MERDEDAGLEVDMMDSDNVVSLDDPELVGVSAEDRELGGDGDGARSGGFGNYSGDDDGDDVPFNPFALNSSESDFWSDDSEGFEAEGDPNTPVEEVYTPTIDEGDFLDPAQRFLFKRLKQHIRDACNINTKTPERMKALEWIFVPSTRDKSGIEFELTCRALGARPLVMRARTMHQLWQASIMLSEALPLLAAIPPQSLMSEIDARIGPGAPGQIAREIWYWPSIPVEVLRSRFMDIEDRKYHAALASLDALGYTAISFGRVYFISRNPGILTLGGRNRFQFASSLTGDY